MNDDRSADGIRVRQRRDHDTRRSAKLHLSTFIRFQTGEYGLRVRNRLERILGRTVRPSGYPRCHVAQVLRILNLEPWLREPFDSGKASQ